MSDSKFEFYVDLGGSVDFCCRGHNIETCVSFRVSDGEGEVVTSAMNSNEIVVVGDPRQAYRTLEY